MTTLDEHMLDCEACRDGDEPCALGEALMAEELALEFPDADEANDP